MFETNSLVYFRDESFRARFGKIIRIISEDVATVTLSVISDGTFYEVRKIKPDAAHLQAAKKHYRDYGHY